VLTFARSLPELDR